MKRKSCIVLIILMIWGLALVNVALATDTVLYNFTSAEQPYATSNLVIGPDGTMYGMTYDKGPLGFGTIFKFTGGAISLLHEFQGGLDGKNPQGSLTLSSNGLTLYGMTMGDSSDTGCDEGSCGTIFKIATNAVADDSTAITVLHSFGGYGASPADGSSPVGNLTLSSDGTTLYGMTFKGGVTENGNTHGGGTIFKISTASPYNISSLHNFTGAGGDGRSPYGNLTLSSDGTTLYGMTGFGGVNNLGAIFKIATNVDATNTNTPSPTIHSFSSATTDGSNPYTGSLTLSSNETTLYGMTQYGGANGLGTIFKIPTTAPYSISLLRSFTDADEDGSMPYGSLTLSSDGTTLYGPTDSGGANNIGMIFKILTTGSYDFSLLHSFGGSGDGTWPEGSLTLSSDGATLYGMTGSGGNDLTACNGNGCGTIFSVPLPVLSVTPASSPVAADAGTTPLYVTNTNPGTGSMSWTATVTPSAVWLSISPTSGTDTDAGTITASFSANTTTSSRSAIIVVTVPGAAGSPMSVNVTQSGTAPTYTVYNGNGNSSGFVPVDSTTYSGNATVTVLDNIHGLFKTNYTFSGWNTQAGGNGTARPARSFFDWNNGTEDVNLYAVWTLTPTPGPLLGPDPYVLLSKLTASNPANSNDYSMLGISVAISADGSRIVATSNNKMAYSFDRPANGVWADATETVVVPRPDDAYEWAQMVAISSDGSTAAIAGALEDDYTSVWVFKLVNGIWSQRARIHPAAAYFESVAISGDGLTVVAGAPEGNESVPRGVGLVYVFKTSDEWDDDILTPTYTLTQDVTNAGDSFGGSVTISQDGSTVAVGADNAPCARYEYDDYVKSWECYDSGPGAAYVFTKDGSSWSQAKLTAIGGANEDAFGARVAISSNGLTVAASAWNVTINGIDSSGAVYLFEKPGSGGWTPAINPSAKLTASDPIDWAQLGISLAINSDGSTVAATSTNATANSTVTAGATYIFGS